MPDEAQATPKTDAAADATKTEATATNAAQTTGDATGTNSGASAQTFTQADLERIVSDRLTRDRQAREKEAEKAAAKREQEELEKQGKYKEMADKLLAERDAAQAEAKANATKLLQRDVAAKTNLPMALADRLKGETAEEMEADAKTIMAAWPKPAAPNINANSGAGGVPVEGQLSDAERKRIADRMGVDPRYVQ